MSFRRLGYRGWLPVLVVSACLVWPAMAQQYGRPPEADRSGGYDAPAQPTGQAARQPRLGPARPVYRLADQSAAVANRPMTPDAGSRPKEHPLEPAVRWAREGLENIRLIQDYSTIMVKRERINGKLGEEEFMFVKVRHRPLSVYMYFLKPQSLQGQEVIWIEGQNDGKMWAHGTGIQSLIGTVSLNPTSPIAMKGNRYPITEIGILNLVERLIEVGERDSQYGECEVKFFPKATINDRSCTLVQIMHPVPRRNFLFHVARIFVDEELNLPIRYEAYDWPSEPGGQPVLMEQYTYVNLKLNNGFTDADFDIRNPQYGFKPE
jgi:hypothetical protein